MHPEQIEFNKSRDFSETLTISFAFIKQNFKGFFKTILFLVGPILLINAILSGIYLQNMFDINSIMAGNRFPSEVFSPIYFLIIIFSIVANIMLVGIAYEYIILYEKKGLNNFTINDVWNAFVADLGLIVSTFFFLIGVLILFGFAFALISLLLSLLGAVGVALLFIIFLVTFFLLGPPLVFLISAIYPIRIRERIGNVAAFSKAYNLTKANFGGTWVIIFISYLIIIVLALVLTIPAAIVGGMAAMHSVNDASSVSSLLLTVVNIVSTFGGSLVNALLFIIIGFHYFSINEKENGDGLLDRINQIGQHNENNDDITI
ncbi:MAG: hypothetical protein K0B10_11810 [Vicingaceae bacterium]|nr:hypothetical protein [Vicingaceae bacterium]